MFRDVLDKREGNQAARRGLALALISMGQPELAERQLEAALLADGRDYRTLNAYGVVLDMMGRHAEAQARYRQGIEVAPDLSWPLRNNYGLSLGDFRAAAGSDRPAPAAGQQPRRRRPRAPEPGLRLRHERRLRELPAGQPQGPRRGERPAPAVLFHAAQDPAGRSAQRRAPAQSKLLPAIRQLVLRSQPEGGRPCADFGTERSGSWPASSD